MARGHAVPARGQDVHGDSLVASSALGTFCILGTISGHPVAVPPLAPLGHCGSTLHGPHPGGGEMYFVREACSHHLSLMALAGCKLPATDPLGPLGVGEVVSRRPADPSPGAGGGRPAASRLQGAWAGIGQPVPKPPVPKPPSLDNILAARLLSLNGSSAC